MPQITHVGRVMVPVADQDTAIAFYTDTLGFSLTADVPFGEGDRWVEVAPPGGGTTIALVPPQGDYQPGRMTGIALDSPDPKADHAALKAAGVDVDAELMGGDGVVPLLFFFRDQDANHVMIVEAQAG
jgi:catechol 2,3-dioxygenase-like lactoylglutathione lyase family enzyme